MGDRFKNVIAMEPPGWCQDAGRTVSKLTMYNNDELHIENFRHVIYSDDEKLSVKTRKGIINVYGMGLQIECYTSYELRISGKISSVDWLGV